MTSPNVNWRSTEKTVLQRSRHMLNNAVMSDIAFTCEGSDRKFSAHKYVLGTSSAVFEAMFYGELAETSSVIHLGDADEKGLEEFLKFIYTDECSLTTDNTMSVMYLSKKYIVDPLTEHCLEYLLGCIQPDNVLGILEDAVYFGEENLVMKCWEYIQKHTSKVVALGYFNNISQKTLASLLKRDELDIPEVELFQAVLKWCDYQCSLRNNEATGENRRSVIGEAICGLRFLGMSQKDFATFVSKSGLLTADELVSVYETFNGIDSSLKWLLPVRERPSKEKIRFTRFKHLRGHGQQYGGIQDRICFSVSKDAIFHGVRLIGDSKGSQYEVILDVKEAQVSGTYTSEGIPFGCDVMLKSPITIDANEVITLSAKIEGPPSYRGVKGASTLEVDGITVTFSEAPQPNNGNSPAEGQFHEIILSI